MTLTLGLFVTESGSARRVRHTTDVIAGWTRAWLSTSPPMKPVTPASITFISAMFLEDGPSIDRLDRLRQDREVKMGLGFQASANLSDGKG